MPQNPLLSYLVLQRALDRDILTSLRVSAVQIDNELRTLQARSGIGAAIRAEQLKMTQIAMHREMERLWTNVGNLTEAYKSAAAAAGAESMLNPNLLSSVFGEADVDYLTRSAREAARQGLRTAEERLSGASHVPLAQSVYDNQALASGKIDEIVNAALTRGASAAELARDVRAYVNPNTPGGVRYASMRLGRTELNNAFHASQIRQAQQSPWTTAVKWNLSGSHPVPDECNQYAEEEHFTGGEAGQFKPSEVPGKPHPNCLCYTTTEDVDPNEFIRQFEAGQYDDYLRELNLPEDLPSPSFTAAPSLPPLPKSGVSPNLKVLSPSDAEKAWQTLDSVQDRAEMLWSETVDGSNVIRNIYRNRADGKPDLYGFSAENTPGVKEYLIKDFDDGSWIYGPDDLANDFISAADHLAERLNDPTEFPELFRGMNLQNRDLFNVGDEITGELTSWTSSQGMAERFSVEGGSGDGWPVIMIVRNARGIRLDSDQVSHIFHQQEEHLIRGKFTVTRKTYSGDTTILEVTYA